MLITKTADSKGRITLGERFANRTVIIREVDETEVVVTLARILPEREIWLLHNDAANASVLRGLEQAKAGDLVNGPDLAGDKALAERLEGEA
jgi:hypothetical protein